MLYPIGQRNRLYVTQAPNLKVLASKLEPQSYVTADVVLADGLLIGSIPGTLTCAYPGNKRKIFETPFGQVRFLSIKKELIFGVQAIKQGVRVADVEKAYLDLLYFYQKGSRFVCDPFQDIKVWKINQKKINQYLKTYTNPRFIKFVKNSLSENV